MPENITSIILLTLWLVLMLLLAIKFIRSKCAPVRTVKATVIDKNKVEFFSRSGQRAKYAVVFQTDQGKKLSFYVSEFSYGGYRQGETGTLKYKGDRIIDFC